MTVESPIRLRMAGSDYANPISVSRAVPDGMTATVYPVLNCCSPGSDRHRAGKLPETLLSSGRETRSTYPSATAHGMKAPMVAPTNGGETEEVVIDGLLKNQYKRWDADPGALTSRVIGKGRRTQIVPEHTARNHPDCPDR